MNARQQDIEHLLQAGATLKVADLARRFWVSGMTIRRDLDALESAGRLARTHGGAVLSRAGVIEFAFAEAGRRHAAEKRAIAGAVAAEIRPGMTVSLDTGTTTLEVARAMAGLRNVKVLTASLAAASVLYAHADVELVLLGGTARRGSPDLTGPLTEENLGRFRVDLAVLGADALAPDGVYTTDVGVSRVCRAMAAHARRAIVAADSSKIGHTAFYRIAGWSDFHELVTDAGVPAPARKWLAKIGCRVQYVPVPAPGTSGATPQKGQPR